MRHAITVTEFRRRLSHYLNRALGQEGGTISQAARQRGSRGPPRQEDHQAEGPAGVLCLASPPF